MALRRFQPISRSAQWSETVSWTDPRTREKNSLAGAVLTMGLYGNCGGSQWNGYGRGDYGWPLPRGYENPILSAQTQADGSGPFFILPDQVRAQWIFPAGTLANLWAPEVTVLVWATVDGATDEVLQATIPVLPGPRALPVAIPAA